MNLYKYTMFYIYLYMYVHMVGRVCCKIARMNVDRGKRWLQLKGTHTLNSEPLCPMQLKHFYGQFQHLCKKLACLLLSCIIFLNEKGALQSGANYWLSFWVWYYLVIVKFSKALNILTENILAYCTLAWVLGLKGFI